MIGIFPRQQHSEFVKKGFGNEDGVVPVVIVTHCAREADVAAAVTEVEKLDVSSAPVVRIRLEALN